MTAMPVQMIIQMKQIKSDYPNIIVVMDEAFQTCQCSAILIQIQTICRFVHSLEKGNENTITGYLNTSVCGGNTADTEFEFLTGNTMAFLPVGSIPYQQYIKSTTPSLASYLKKHRLRNVCTASVLWQWMEPGYGLSSFGI